MWYKITIMKKRNAQQLIEFLLIAPFIIIIFGLLTEFAYALNVNLSLYHGLRTVTSTIYSEIKPNMTAEDIRLMVLSRLRTHLAASNVPTNANNALDVRFARAGENAGFVATYTYISAFSLPKVYFHILPSEFHFSAVSVVPSAFLRPNNYDNIDSLALDTIWATPASFFDINGFNASKLGIMKKSVNTMDSQTSKMAFLVPVAVEEKNGVLVKTDSTYYVVGWDGKKTTDQIANLGNDRMYNCSLVGFDIICSTGSGDLASILSNYSTVYVFDELDYGMTYDSTTDCKSGQMCSGWLTGSDVPADAAADGALKRALALFNTTENRGNYDGFSVNSYNPAASGGNTYKVKYSNNSRILIQGADLVVVPGFN